VAGSPGEHPDRHAALVDVLEEARSLGFLGPGPVERQLRHAVDLCRAIGPFADRFLDLGSGGGLPGLVLAVEYPAATGALLDSQQRRCEFMRRGVARLELKDRLVVECGRAETLARTDELRGEFDLVVARSFGSPAATAECAVGFLRAGGALIVTEPPESGAAAERWPDEGLAQLGFAGAVEIRHGETGAVRMVLGADPDDRWPRRDGVPGKRPLW
jgi:16S rRNA (guanine527-N7)-methyltransferase